MTRAKAFREPNVAPTQTERKSSHARGFFSSQKAGARIVCRSQRDHVFLIWAETEPTVAAMRARPDALKLLPDGGRWQPDFEILFEGRRTLVALTTPRLPVPDRLDDMTKAARLIDREVLVLSDTALLKEPAFANRRRLLRARGHRTDPASRATLLGAVTLADRPLTELSALLTSPRPLDDIFGLCLEGSLAVVDLDWPLGDHSMIALGPVGRHE